MNLKLNKVFIQKIDALIKTKQDELIKKNLKVFFRKILPNSFL